MRHGCTLAGIVGLLCSPVVNAQSCTPGVIPGYDFGSISFSGSSLVDGPIRVAAVFDAGQGPEIYIAGTGVLLPEGGPVYLARFSGGRWTGVPGVAGPVLALRVADLGSGPRLYAAGTFAQPGGGTRVSVGVFDGQDWTLLGTTPTARAVLPVMTAVGPRIFIAGQNLVREWNGTAWIDLPGVGVGGFSGVANSGIRVLEWFDDGSGAKLYAGGAVWWDTARTKWGFAAWDGAAWVHTPGLTSQGTWPEITGAAVHVDGGVPRLFATGMFGAGNVTTAQPLAKLVGGTWEAVPTTAAFSGMGGATLLSVPTSTGPDLYFTTGNDPHTANTVRRYRDGVVSALPGQFGLDSGSWTNVRCLVPQGESVVALGSFNRVDSTNAPGAAVWGAAAWGAIEPVGLGSFVQAGPVVPDLTDPTRVYISNRTFSAAGAAPSDLTRTPTSMVRLGPPSGRVYMTTTGLGSTVYTNDGSGWTAVAGAPASRSVWIATDTGVETPVLLSSNGRTVYRLNGDTAEQLGDQFTSAYAANAVATLNRPAGSMLCVGLGTGLGTNPGVARLVDGQWVIADTPGSVSAMLATDLGFGPELLVGCTTGSNTQVGTLLAWDGETFRDMSAGLPASPQVRQLFSIPSGPLNGLFCVANASIYKWSGAQWETTAAWTTTGAIHAAGATDNGDGSASIFVSGTFRRAGDVVASNIAEIRFCLTTCDGDFNHDGDFGTDQDIEAFFACLGGSCCVTCGSADFNGDGDVGTDQDIESFFRVLAGGAC